MLITCNARYESLDCWEKRYNWPHVSLTSREFFSLLNYDSGLIHHLSLLQPQHFGNCFCLHLDVTARDVALGSSWPSRICFVSYVLPMKIETGPNFET
jgi:hypothetical protein